MTGDRIVDADGHTWPVTGHACNVCRWPLDGVHATIGTHPSCDPLSGGDPGGDPLRDGRARLHHPSMTTMTMQLFIREDVDEVVDTDDPVEDDEDDEDDQDDEDDEDDEDDTHRTNYRGDYR